MRSDHPRPFATFEPPMMFQNQTCMCDHCQAVRSILKRDQFRTDHDTIYAHLKQLAQGNRTWIEPTGRTLPTTDPSHQSDEDLYTDLLQLVALIRVRLDTTTPG